MTMPQKPADDNETPGADDNAARDNTGTDHAGTADENSGGGDKADPARATPDDTGGGPW